MVSNQALRMSVVLFGLVLVFPITTLALSSVAPKNNNKKQHVASRLRSLFARTSVFFSRSNRHQAQTWLLTRRSINDFEPNLPHGWEAAMRDAILAATHAPNHKRTEPWRFHLLGPASMETICQLQAELVRAKKGEAAAQTKLQRWRSMPGWLVVTCVTSSSSTMDEPMGVAREDYAACCCAVQNLLLSLHAQGIGTKWTTGAVNFDDRFAAAAGLPPNEYVVGTIWFGTPAKVPKHPPAKKLAIDEVLTRHD